MNEHVLKCYAGKAIKILLKNLLSNKTIIYCIAFVKLSMQAKCTGLKLTMWPKAALLRKMSTILTLVLYNICRLMLVFYDRNAYGTVYCPNVMQK